MQDLSSTQYFKVEKAPELKIGDVLEIDIYNAACMNFSILSNENIACLLLLYLLHLGVK